MWGGLIVIGVIAFSNGDPNTLFLPYDSVNINNLNRMVINAELAKDSNLAHIPI